jgi:hypothetical protein
MSPAQQIVQAIKALVTEPSWLPTQVQTILQLQLQRDRKALESTKRYVATGPGAFRSVKLLVQTFEVLGAELTSYGFAKLTS